MSTEVVQIRQKGTITIPKGLRRAYGMNEGDVLDIIDLGNGALLLTPRASRVAKLGDEVSRILTEEGVGLDDVLQALDQERERYYREHYQPAKPSK
jgi:AbrB family looped-hinge helix DNA binding protein